MQTYNFNHVPRNPVVRFNSTQYPDQWQGLTDEQLIRAAPAVFAASAHESRSQRYGFIPTIDMVNGMRQQGFLPVSIMQARSRDEDRRGHARHLIRFRHERSRDRTVKNFSEVVLLNSHDGTSSYRLMSGVYRVVCSNGLIVGSTVEEIRLPHTQKALDQVVEASFTVLENADRVQEDISVMENIPMNRPAQEAFGQSALQLMYAGVEDPPVINPDQMIIPRRNADRVNNLWTTFNVVQENVMRGGVRYHREDQHGRIVNASTREIRSVDRRVRLNRDLWDVAANVANMILNGSTTLPV